MSREVDLRKAVKTLLKGLQQQVFLIHKDEARNTRISLSTAQPIGPYWVRQFLRRHLDGWCSAIVASIHPFFRRFIQIGAANSTLVESPVSWARQHVEAALEFEFKHNAVELWLRWSTVDDAPLSIAIIEDPKALAEYLTEWQPPSWLLESFAPSLLEEPYVQWDTVIFDTPEQNFRKFVQDLTDRFRGKLRTAIERIEEIEQVECLTWLSYPNPVIGQRHKGDDGGPQESRTRGGRLGLAACARTVAPGVAQVTLTDLNVPVGTALKETKGALLKLGALSRKLKDPRILQAADYRLANPRTTYKEISQKFFGTTRRADSIRSWANKRRSSQGPE